MAITAETYRCDRLLVQLKKVWHELSDEERSAVEVVVNSIVHNHAVEEARFPALTEAELFERIDRSIKEADAGEFMDSEVFEQDLAAEFGLA